MKQKKNDSVKSVRNNIFAIVMIIFDKIMTKKAIIGCLLLLIGYGQAQLFGNFITY